MEDKTTFLRNTEIFAEAGNDTLMKIADALISENYRKNQLIIRKGEKGQSMYIIVSGKVRVHDGGHVLSRLSEGKCFGEYSLFDEETRSASVTAEVNTELYKLEQKDFFDLIAKDAEITRGILKVLIRQMRDRNVLEEKLSKSYIKIQKQKEEIAAQNDSILEQKQLLEQQNYDLLSLNEEKNNLLSVVVHGLRNPLTSSLCLADMLRNEKELLHENHKEYTDVICKSLHRMNGMINQMLNLNKIDSKKFKLQLEKLSISQVIRDVIQNFQIIAKQKNIDFKLSLKNLYSKLNRVYLMQIVDNLVSNAIKFTPENSVIEINLKEANGKVVLEIIDEGPGIDEKTAKMIFNLYERQTSKINMTENQKGLGLAIVNKYVTAMHGKVWYETEKGNGTKFVVEFARLIEDPNQE